MSSDCDEAANHHSKSMPGFQHGNGSVVIQGDSPLLCSPFSRGPHKHTPSFPEQHRETARVSTKV